MRRLNLRRLALLVSLLSALALAIVHADAATFGSAAATVTPIAPATYGYDQVAHNAHGARTSPVDGSVRVDARAPTNPATRSANQRFADFLAAKGGANVIVDTNAVFNRSGVNAALRSGETPVVTQTTRAELANLVASGRVGMPRYAEDLRTIPDVMDVHLRINIRGAMRPGQRGLFGDGAIGATAVRNGSPVITADRNFGSVLESFGVEVRTP